MATQGDSSSDIPPPPCSGIFMPHISITTPLSSTSLITTSTPLHPSPLLSSTLNAPLPSLTLLASDVASPIVPPLICSIAGYSSSISQATSGDYDTLVTTLQHYPLELTFDDLRPKLLLQEQRIKSMVDRDDSPSHHAFVAVQSKGTSGSFNFMQQGTSKGRGKRRNYHERGRGQRYGGQQGTAPYSSYSEPTNSSNRFQNGNNSSSGILGSSPTSDTCGLCWYPGHQDAYCPHRFNPSFHKFPYCDLVQSSPSVSSTSCDTTPLVFVPGWSPTVIGSPILPLSATLPTPSVSLAVF
ncbi:hypothetical protein L6452_32442 [Arctium lappa]|uniref:Uncharacterized protein n=1 Tax=Arctium lappa TaxID=4217 RepID=A0ACB8Z4Z9_ARCLA|nr:hypothetical protein L6452_32442 [Arctium lappa]